jgi:multiple sugar transport system permease protein
VYEKMLQSIKSSPGLRTKPKGWLKRGRMLLLGKEADRGLLFKIFIYLVLIDTAYIYLRPIFYLVTKMITSPGDASNPAVTWIPTAIYLEHLKGAWTGLNYMKSFMVSFGMAGVSALLTIVFCSVAGYAFARLQFPFKRTLFVLLLFAFILPQQITIMPMMIFYTQQGMYNTIWPVLLPALFGHGLKGALFVIIFRQFFSTLPRELEEAAKMDGASVFRVYYRVMLPLAKPALLVVFLFSFVWTWNDAYLPSMYMPKPDFPPHIPLSMGVEALNAYIEYLQQNPPPGTNIVYPEPIRMAAFFLVIMPPLLLYAIAQRWFVEGVERTGLVE